MIFLTGRTAQDQERYENTDRLISAAYNGMLWEVKQYIPISNVDGFESKALRVAIERGHIECAIALVPHTSPVWVERFALRTACKSHQVSMFDLLVPHTDSIEVMRLMAWLLDNEHENSARALLPYVNLDEVAEKMNRFPNKSKGFDLLVSLQAEAQKDVIQSNLSETAPTSCKRKI